MPPLRPESRWSSTLVQTVSVIATVAVSAWYVRGTYEEVIREQAQFGRELKQLRSDLDTRYVTQDQAERYASNFRWINRAVSIEVPEPSKFKSPYNLSQ
jgi:hypothetical protein